MASPRIIAGSAKGKRLKSIPGTITRPITDRVKEALFNIIGNDIVEASFLDLFAGTGSVGLEALSRGANFTRFTEINPSVIKILKENILTCGFTDRSDVVRTAALQYLSANQHLPFNYIYIAPPQYKSIWVQVMNLVDQNKLHYYNDSWIIVQIDPLEYQPLPLLSLREIDKRRYGSTLLIFYQNIN